jgi:glyoxylase-like metal-dependent hydrolase (beta-lactamase superfamily II)
MRLLALVVTAIALQAAAPVVETPSSELPRPADGYFQERTVLAPGVWVLAQPGFVVQPAGNVTIVEQADGLVLVDAGGSRGAARRVVEHVRRLSGKPVKAVIITHWHGDHPQGLAEVLKAWPRARTIATAATQAHLRDPKTMNTPATLDPYADAAFRKQVEGFAAYSGRMADQAADPGERAGWKSSQRLFRQYALDMDGAVTLAPAEGFQDRLSIPDARAPIEVAFLGGANTDGDAVVWLPKQRILVTGDIVVAPIPFGFGSYPANWLAVLEKLGRYEFRILVPGHGGPQRDRAYVDKLTAALVEVRAKTSALWGQGLTLDEVQRRIDLSAQATGFVGDDPWLRRWFRDYWVTPIVASAYKEAKGEPIVQSLGR